MRHFLLFALLVFSSCATSLSPSTRTEIQEQIRAQVRDQLAEERDQRQAAIQAAVKTSYFSSIIHLLLFTKAADAGFAITSVDIEEAECVVYDICYQGTVIVRRGDEQALPIQFIYDGVFWKLQIDYGPLIRRMKELQEKEQLRRQDPNLPLAPKPDPELSTGVL